MSSPPLNFHTIFLATSSTSAIHKQPSLDVRARTMSPLHLDHGVLICGTSICTSCFFFMTAAFCLEPVASPPSDIPSHKLFLLAHYHGMSCHLVSLRLVHYYYDVTELVPDVQPPFDSAAQDC